MSLQGALATSWKVAALAAAFAAAAALGASVSTPSSPMRRLFGRYVGAIEATFARAHVAASASRVAVGVLVAAGGAVALAACAGDPLLLALAVGALLGPSVYAQRAHRRHLAALNGQVEGFLVAFANALRTIPNAGAALRVTSTLLQDPLRAEVERAMAEMRIGRTLDEALRDLALRAKSPVLDDALVSVRIALDIGGDLPSILQTTAASLREMSRLDGVVKTKTADARSQLWVLAVFPLVIVGLFHTVQPGYFDSLTASFLGYAATGLAISLWLAAIALARRILAVDL